MTIVTIGIDLAKNVFAVHGVDATGKPVLVRPIVPRGKLRELIASIPACLIGMEACSGANHWAREFARFGHTVRLMAPKFVSPYRLSGKPVCGVRRWALDVQSRSNHNKAACALANKLARICYATLRDQEPFGEQTVRLGKKINRESFVMPA